jgi:Mpv17 / PMP22 family
MVARTSRIGLLVLFICIQLPLTRITLIDAYVFVSTRSPTSLRSMISISSPTKSVSSWFTSHHPTKKRSYQQQMHAMALPTTISTCSEAISYWYLTYPYLSALMTCACKAGIADYIVQSTAAATTTTISKTRDSDTRSITQPQKHSMEPSNDTINIGRNIGFILYGGLYQGVFQQYMYATVFPMYFDENDLPFVLSTMFQVALDMLILGPFLCLPIAYIVQSICTTTISGTASVPPTSTTQNSNSIMGSHNKNPRAPFRSAARTNRDQVVVGWFDHSTSTTSSNTAGSAITVATMTPTSVIHEFSDNCRSLLDVSPWNTIHPVLQNGWDQYVYDVQYQNILTKYWSLWIPVKCLTFTMIPYHLRIVFIAVVSFFWMMILSASTSNKDEPK